MLRSSLSITFSKLGISLLSFASLAFFSQRLGAAAIGVYALYQALLQIISFLTDLGLNDAVVKRVSEQSDPGKVMSAAFLIKAPLVVAAVCGILLFQNSVNQYLGREFALLLAVGVVLQTYLTLCVHVVQSEVQMGRFAALQFSETFITTVGGVLFVVSGFGIKGVIYTLILSKVIVILASFIIIQTRFAIPSVAQCLSLYQFSKFNVVTKLSGRALSWIDVLLIGVFLSQAHVGAYEVAWRVSKLSLLLATAVGNYIFPNISRLDTEGTNSEIHDAIRDGLTLSLAVPVPALFGVALFAEDILGLLFGTEFSSAGLALVVLMIGRIMNAVSIIFQKSLQGIGRIKKVGFVAAISGLVNLAANGVLIWSYGITGAAVATTLSFAVGAVLMYKWLADSLEVTVESRLVLWMFASSLGMLIILSIITRMLGVSSIFWLIGQILFGSVLYILLMWANPSVRRSLKWMINQNH